MYRSHYFSIILGSICFSYILRVGLDFETGFVAKHLDCVQSFGINAVLKRHTIRLEFRNPGSRVNTVHVWSVRAPLNTESVANVTIWVLSTFRLKPEKSENDCTRPSCRVRDLSLAAYNCESSAKKLQVKYTSREAQGCW